MPMTVPLSGDVLIRSVTPNRFELVDLVTHELVDGPFDDYRTALAAARLRNARGIWQQNVDERGRLLGEPFKLPLR
jgi:hypothetical protein